MRWAEWARRPRSRSWCSGSAPRRRRSSPARTTRSMVGFWRNDLRRGSGAYDQRFHRVVLGQPELVGDLGGHLVALLDPLPELALVDAGERSAILLALMPEDGAHLDAQ